MAKFNKPNWDSLPLCVLWFLIGKFFYVILNELSIKFLANKKLKKQKKNVKEIFIAVTILGTGICIVDEIRKLSNTWQLIEHFIHKISESG